MLPQLFKSGAVLQCTAYVLVWVCVCNWKVVWMRLLSQKKELVKESKGEQKQEEVIQLSCVKDAAAEEEEGEHLS